MHISPRLFCSPPIDCVEFCVKSTFRPQILRTGSGRSTKHYVSMSTEPVEEPGDDSGRTSRHSSPSPFQTMLPNPTPDICGIPHNSESALSEVLESSLRLQGGDIHRDMYRIKARANSLRRSATFSHQPSPRLQPADELSYPEQREPGGFRRQHLQYRARQGRVRGTLVSRNFVDFLDLYGSFAGEDLEDADTSDDGSATDDRSEMLRRPLLGRHRSSRRFLRNGDASTLKTFFTLLKAFIGTGIMFLPKAFLNGGILFSSSTLVVVSLINCLCFRLLLDCRRKHGVGYGELGATIVGPRFRSVILTSIALSQLGFVCAGLIFTAENLLAFLQATTKNTRVLMFGVPSLIALQLIPLISLFSSDWFTYAIFTFEGIGLILPIQSSMRKPEHFSSLLYLVMFIITIIFISSSPVVNTVQLLYSLAVLGGEPVQLFPAVRIIETSLFGERGTAWLEQQT
ncbi:hypothetical protein L249_4182 [Ophiocordyceps polyrhachis-furcata BCC 54312]|uniref:Amino acid transporter transmembrane domain-containing protein n=1 Tax=Ophiocordyceps polyrhachis-furcata BCC 54312 TaxID=1330021 RepID=A0A367LCB4_9HYPO|nr:hypothetical protein L249_4182 [Ophiocordyceps polyrhachis-furcata BCC 54312]